MGTLIKTGTLIQKNFWICLALASLSLTIAGAGRVTIELRQRQTNEAMLEQEVELWFNDLKNNLPQKELQYLKSLTPQEKQKFYLNIQ